MFDTEFCKNQLRPLNFRRIWIFSFFYRDIKFKKFDVSTKLSLWGSQNQATYFLKETTLWNRWRSNMVIPIHILFFTWLFLGIKLMEVKGRLNTDTSPHNFWTTFLDNHLTEQFKKSAVTSAIAIPLPLCSSCFVPLRRFRENLTKPFYFYLFRTCDSPGGTPSVISLALRKNLAWCNSGRNIEENETSNMPIGLIHFYQIYQQNSKILFIDKHI